MNPSKTTAKSSVLVIAGMHRSGTSLTTSLLQSAGLHIGRNLLGSERGNEKGHFENIDFLKLHEAILRSQGISHEGWTLQENISVEEQFVAQAKEIVTKNAVSSIWGWKEPRTTLFLEFWADLLPEANFLLVYRNPWDVVDSLYRRSDQTFQQEPELAVKFWLHYNQKIINFYNYFSRRCLLANIQGIIQEPAQYVDVINDKFKTKLLKPASNLYDSSLFKTQDLEGNRPSLIEHYFPEAIEMYQELEARAWQPNELMDLSWRDKIKSSPYRVSAFQDWKNLKQAEAKNQVVTDELKDVKLQLSQTQDELQKTRLELEQRYSQLHQVQEELEQFQLQFKQVQGEAEKARFQQTIAYKGEDKHELLVWSAWQAYRNQDKAGMAKYLQQSLKHKPFSPTETVLKWIETFTRFSAERGEQLDTHSLVNSEEWQQLMRRCMVRNLAFSRNGK